MDGLTPHVWFCTHCRAKWRRMFEADAERQAGPSPPRAGGLASWVARNRWAMWRRSECTRLTEMLHRSLIEMTHEVEPYGQADEARRGDRLSSHPKPGTDDDYDATLTEVYLTHPWVHSAWRSGELAGYSAVYHVPVLFNVYPHRHFTAAKPLSRSARSWPTARIRISGARWACSRCSTPWPVPGPPNSTSTRRPPVKFLALPRDLHVSDTQSQTPWWPASPTRAVDRFLAPYVGRDRTHAVRSAVGSLHRPCFEEVASPASACWYWPTVVLISDAQVGGRAAFAREEADYVCDARDFNLRRHGAAPRPDFALADVLALSTSLRARLHHASCPAERTRPVRPVCEPAGCWFTMNRWSWPKRSRKPWGGHGHDAKRSARRVLIINTAKDGLSSCPDVLTPMQATQVTPEIEELFANAVRWAAHSLPIDVVATGTVAGALFVSRIRLDGPLDQSPARYPVAGTHMLHLNVTCASPAGCDSHPARAACGGS